MESRILSLNLIGMAELIKMFFQSQTIEIGHCTIGFAGEEYPKFHGLDSP